MDLDAAKVTRQKASQAQFWPAVDSIVLTILAACVVLTFRAEFHRFLPLLWIEMLLLFAIPVLLMGWMTLRVTPTDQIFTSRKWVWSLQTGAVASALLPWLLQVTMRQFGLGDAYEVVALTMLLNACWFLAVFSRFGKLDRAAFVIASALVLFVCSLSQQPKICVLGFLYGVVSLWWLLGNYWNRVKVKSIDVESNALPVRGAAVVASLAIITACGFLAASVGSGFHTVSVNGFMPASGGSSWQSAYARNACRA